MAKLNELMPVIHAASPEKRFATEPSVGTLHPIRYATAAQRDLLSVTFARILKLSPPFPPANAMLREWLCAVQFSLTDEYHRVRLFRQIKYVPPLFSNR